MFELSTEEARLLLEVALMATGQNRFKTATTLLVALEPFRAQEPSLAVAKAILFISLQDFAGAVAYIDGDALPRFPDSAMLQAFKGMALLRLQRPMEAREALLAAQRPGSDPAAAQLAADLMTHV